LREEIAANKALQKLNKFYRENLTKPFPAKPSRAVTVNGRFL